MSSLLSLATVFALYCYGVARVLPSVPLLRASGVVWPELALDLLYVHGLLVMLVLNIRNASDTYFEGALLIATFSFVSSSAMAKFILRGEVIE